MPSRYRLGFTLGLVLLALVALGALWIGTSGLGWPAPTLLRVRALRLLAACLVGASLALVGATFQTLLRNPLADPYILGVSGGAALGGSLALALGVPGAVLALGPLVLDLDGTFLAAFGGGLAAVALLFGMARRGRGAMANPYALLLVGFALNAFCSALVLFVRVVVETRKTQEILYWLIGTLSDARLTAGNLGLLGATFALGAGLLIANAKTLNVLSLGDEAAAGLGVDPRRARLLVLLASSAVVGLAVSLAGMVGFVGIIVPQAVRMRFGADLRYLLPLSALYGALFLALADLVSRALFLPLRTELPVGLISALVGAPLFVAILRREGRGA